MLTDTLIRFIISLKAGVGLSNIRRDPLGDGKIIYVSDSHTFGTDAVLLADFAAPRQRDNALDLGTGCGIIPLLWQSSANMAHATGLEIDPVAVSFALKSAEENGWSENLSFVNADMREIKAHLKCESFDLVTCNPPYFKAESGYISPEDARANARTELTCTFDDVCRATTLMLKYGGRFCVCHRPERLTDVLLSMRANKIEPKRLRLVQDRAEKAPWLFLVEGRKGGKGVLEIQTPLIMKNSDGTRTAEMKRIYGKYGEGFN